MEPGYDYRRQGDWLVPERDYEAAKREFRERSPGSRARDRMSRAPIETDFEKWRRNQRGLDYPGVDTPTGSPRVSLLDEFWRSETGGGGTAVLDQEDRGLLGPLGDRELPERGTMRDVLRL